MKMEPVAGERCPGLEDCEVDVEGLQSPSSYRCTFSVFQERPVTSVFRGRASSMAVREVGAGTCRPPKSSARF